MIFQINIILFLFFKIIASFRYIGVEGYGEIQKKEVLNPESQIYRFLDENLIEKKYKIYPGDIINKTYNETNYTKYKCEDGAYPIQNKLIQGYDYELTIEDNNCIKDIKQITHIENNYIPPVKYIPGLRTLKNFISSAFQPLGTTLYVFGGGWDYQDLGTSNEGRNLGISPNWVKFFDDHNGSYTYKDSNNKNESFYPFGGFNQFFFAGLDCSGYVGWSIYNNLYNTSLKNGFVTNARKLAKNLADQGFGTWMHSVNGSNYTNPNYTLLTDELKVGDILSTDGHVMIVLAKCNDGSFIIMHSTPSNSKIGYPGGGVQMTPVNHNNSGSKECEAYLLCKEYMEKYFKKWSDRYDVYVIQTSTVFNFAGDETGIFHWNLDSDIISDPDGYSSKSADEILNDLFKKDNDEDDDDSDDKTLILVIVFGSLIFIIIIILIIVLINKYRKKKSKNELNEEDSLLIKQ